MRISWVIVTPFDLITYSSSSLVAPVEDKTATLWSKRDECDTVQKGFELVDSRAFIRPLLRVTR
jgi:hypothetical protein